MSIFQTNVIRRTLPFALIVAAFAGCEKAKPRVYVQPKELPPPPEETPAREPEPAPEPERGREQTAPTPRVTYTMPAGWKELGPDQMSVARFGVEAGGGAASVNVTPLPLLEGKEAMLVNMWRQQLGLTELSNEEAAKTLREVDIAGVKGRQFEMTGQREGKGVRIVTAFLRHGDRSWFFKLQGDTAAVDAALAPFGEFLKTVKFEASAGAAPAPAVEMPPVSAMVIDTPAGWVAVPPGPMQAAKFTVPEKEGAKAEATVSIFPNDTGGTVANVKRWRVQLGLPDAEDAAILASAKPLEGIEGAMIVELENAGRALTGAIVPRGGRWFFYKLMGGAPAVAASREAFVSLIKKAK